MEAKEQYAMAWWRLSVTSNNIRSLKMSTLQVSLVPYCTHANRSKSVCSTCRTRRECSHVSSKDNSIGRETFSSSDQMCLSSNYNMSSVKSCYGCCKPRRSPDLVTTSAFPILLDHSAFTLLYDQCRTIWRNPTEV